MSYTVFVLGPRDKSFDVRRIESDSSEAWQYPLWRLEEEFEPLEMLVVNIDQQTAVAIATLYSNAGTGSTALVFERADGSVGVRIRLRQPGSVRERRLAREWDAMPTGRLVERYLSEEAA